MFPSRVAPNQPVLAVAGAPCVHVWTQSVEMAEIEHVLRDYEARRQEAGSVSAHVTFVCNILEVFA